jgi:hypothetical protein
MADGSAGHATRFDVAEPQREAWRRLPRQLFATLLALDAVFVLLYLGAVAVHLAHSRYFILFNLDAEANPPSWYSGTQLFLVAIGFFVLASRLIPERHKVAILRPLWLVLGIGFTLLSMDEIGSIHERIGSLLWKLQIFNRIGFGDQWMWLYAIFGVVLVLIYRKQIVLVWREWRFEVLLFVVGFAVLVLGAFVIEAIHLRFASHFHGIWNYLEVAVEEGFEMLGATILILPAFRILSSAMTSAPDPQDTAVSAD